VLFSFRPTIETLIKSNQIAGILFLITIFSFSALMIVHTLMFFAQLLAQNLGYKKSDSINYHISELYFEDNLDDQWNEIKKIEKILRQVPNTELSDPEEKTLREYIRTLKQAERNGNKQEAIQDTIDEYINEYIIQKSVFKTTKLNEIRENASGFTSEPFTKKFAGYLPSERLKKNLQTFCKEFKEINKNNFNPNDLRFRFSSST
jgi:hypothetical protein